MNLQPTSSYSQITLGNGYEYFFSATFYQMLSKSTIGYITKTDNEQDVIERMSAEARRLFHTPSASNYCI